MKRLICACNHDHYGRSVCWNNLCSCREYSPATRKSRNLPTIGDLNDPVFKMFGSTPAEPPNGEYYFDKAPPCEQLWVRYPNEYGAVVVLQPRYVKNQGYVGEGLPGLFQISILHHFEDCGFCNTSERKCGNLCSATKFAYDIAYLSSEQAIMILHEIAHFPKQDVCEHFRSDYNGVSHGFFLPPYNADMR